MELITPLASLARGAALVTLFAAACAPAAAPAPTASNAPAAPQGPVALPPEQQKITIGKSQFVANLDAQANIGSNARRYGLYEMLVGQKGDGAIEPMLSTEWKTVDPTTWQFKILTDRKFHDGSPVTAQDMKFSFDRVIDPANKMAVTARIPTIKTFEIIDAANVRITTKEPDPILLKRVAAVPIFPKAYFDKVGDKEFSVNPIGSGPYKLKQWVANDRVVLSAFNEHPSKPILQEITIRFIPEASARIAGLKTGDLDVIEAVPLDQAKDLEKGDFYLATNTAGRSFGVMLNPLMGGPMADKRVRQAFNYAIDKEAIAKNFFAGLTIPEQGQILQKETFGFNKDLKAYPYDPKKAKELLAAAGYPNGFKAHFDVFTAVPAWTSVALFLQQQLKDIGVEVDISTSSDSAWMLDLFYGRTPRKEMFTGSVANTPAMDASFALDWYRSMQPDGTRRQNNPEFDKYYEPSLSEMNEAKRLELLNKAAEVMREDPPYLFLVQNVSIFAVNKSLQGVLARTDEDYSYETLKKVK